MTTLASFVLPIAGIAKAEVPNLCQSEYNSQPVASYQTSDFIVNICEDDTGLFYVGFSREDREFRTVLDASRIQNQGVTGYAANNGNYNYYIISRPNGETRLQIRELTSGGINSMILNQEVLEFRYY
ncbi:hypothetical protein NG791_00630 [Laspinema sp. D1]|uniref:hypothetical protein n=1 Tax=Laspinema palackyanum TaxID=3231601 RepID=UPI003482A6CF|nr:hypothetical protein [Laspinema sp. D2b]